MASHTFWLMLAVVVQFVWGIYPVSIRFLQTKTPHPLTALQLSFVVNLWSIPALLFGDLLNVIISCCSKRGKGRVGKAPGGLPPHPAVGDSDSPSAPLLGDDAGAASAANGSHVVMASEPPAVAATDQPTLLRKLLVLTGTTAGLTGLFLTQVYSLRFTAAYMSQMLFLLAPLIVAMMARVLFKSPLPKGLWSALALMLLGSGMVIGSKAAHAGQKPSLAAQLVVHQPPAVHGADAFWPGALDLHLASNGTVFTDPGVSMWPGVLFGASLELEEAAFAAATNTSSAAVTAAMSGVATNDSFMGPSLLERLLSGSPVGKKKKPRGGLTFSDVIGLTLALGSALSLASFMLIVQRSQGVVSEQLVLWCGSVFQCLFSCLLTRVVEPGRWYMLLKLLPWEWACIAATAFSVNWAANLLQQVTIRKLGAPQAAAFLPVRLLGSLVASYPILHEGLGSITEAAGAGLLLAAVTGYLLKQRQAAITAAAENAQLADAADAPVPVIAAAV